MTDRPTRLTIELHCHTCHSTDSLLTPAALLEAARCKSIDRVIITDHNTTRGARIAAALDPQRVIIGEEILTTKGELLAFFVREEVPAGLEPAEAIERLRRQGAVISVSHPFDSIRHGSWSEADLRAILPQVDALEVFNARTWSRAPNDRAARLAAEVGSAWNGRFGRAHGIRAGTLGHAPGSISRRRRHAGLDSLRRGHIPPVPAVGSPVLALCHLAQAARLEAPTLTLPLSGGGMGGGHSFVRKCGKRITSRIVSLPVSSIVSRSTPMPKPPFGGMP